MSMVYVAGIIGFIGGFVFGQMVLLFFLRGKTREELLNDPYIKWKYGLLNWIIAGLGAYSAVAMYQYYFG